MPPTTTAVLPRTDEVDASREGPRPARIARGVVGFLAMWIFGLALTALLASVWGRAVAYDDATLLSAGEVAASAELITHRVAGWVAEGIAAARGIEVTQVRAVVEGLAASPDFDAAVATLSTRIVEAALADPGAMVEMSLAEVALPLADEIAAELQRLGLATTTDEVAATIAALPPVVLTASDLPVPPETIVQARRGLSLASVIASLVLVVAGAVAVAAADDRRLAVRALGQRILMGAASFAVFLRVSAWIVDPAGGATPARQALGIVLRSNLHVPVVAGVVGLGVVAASYLAVRRRRGPSAAETIEQPVPGGGRGEEPGVAAVEPAGGVGDRRERAPVRPS